MATPICAVSEPKHLSHLGPGTVSHASNQRRRGRSKQVKLTHSHFESSYLEASLLPSLTSTYEVERETNISLAPLCTCFLGLGQPLLFCQMSAVVSALGSWFCLFFSFIWVPKEPFKMCDHHFPDQNSQESLIVILHLIYTNSQSPPSQVLKLETLMFPSS